jgi:hypothetical protein
VLEYWRYLMGKRGGVPIGFVFWNARNLQAPKNWTKGAHITMKIGLAVDFGVWDEEISWRENEDTLDIGDTKLVRCK